MINVRRAADRGRTSAIWLDSRHTFSFGGYDDPRHRGFGPLVTINEDRVREAAGFPPHGHRDMEILSFVVAGTLEHQDSLGHRRRIGAGDVQWMSAGTGIRHSEYNPSATEPLHFLQVWIEPERAGLPPAYAERHLSPADLAQGWRLVAAPAGSAPADPDGPLPLRRDAFIHRAQPAAGECLSHCPAAGRRTWLQVIAGSVSVGDWTLTAGDGAAAAGEDALEVIALENADVLLFDLL